VIHRPLDVVNAHPATMEEFPLPQSIFEQLEHDLLSSNGLLPLRAQVLQNWKVGLLDRFEPGG
jgi:hypothetical protein